MLGEANIAILRQRKTLCLAGTAKRSPACVIIQDQLAGKENGVEVENRVEASLLNHPNGQGRERCALRRGSVRAAMERAMIQRQMTQLTAEMMKNDASLRRRAQSGLGRIERRIGRCQGKYPAAARLLKNCP